MKIEKLIFWQIHATPPTWSSGQLVLTKKQKFEFANRNHAPSKGAQCALDMLCAQITTLENRSTV